MDDRSLADDCRAVIDRVHDLYWRVAALKGSDLSKEEENSLSAMIFELDRLGDACEEALGAQLYPESTD